MIDFNAQTSNGSDSSEGTLLSVLVTKKALASSDPSRPPKEKKNVHFKSSVKVRKITSHRKYTEEEKANTWLSTHESKQIRANAVKTVKKLMKGIDVDALPGDCSRGLELKTPQKNKIRQTRKLDVIYSVLGEQEQQQEEGLNDQEAIAKVYRSFASKCALEASRRGSKDELEAQDC